MKYDSGAAEILSFAPEDRVLFVGEGNFSFSLALAERANSDRLAWTSTCFETGPVSELAAKNATHLRALGVTVRFGVNASRSSDLMDNSCGYSKIVFMFPHVGGKMQIQKNRRLLRSFAASAATALASFPSARVIVALCNGQGGTQADTARRPAEADTWQAVKMFADAGLQLVSAVSLGRVEDLVPGYFSYGYRGLNKAFHTEGAVLHVFASNPCPYLEVGVAQPRLDFVGNKLELLEEGSCPLAKRLEHHCRSFAEIEELDRQTLATITPPAVLLNFNDPTPLGSNPFKLYLYQLHGDTQDRFGEVVHRDERGVVMDITEKLEVETCESWKEMWARVPSFSPASYSHDLRNGSQQK